MTQTTATGRSDRALVFSPMLPPRSEVDRGGMHRRMALFLRALARRFRHIDLVHIVPPEMVAGAGENGALDRLQSDFWGVDVHSHRVARRVRTETLWNHYGAGVLDAGEQPALRGYGGRELAGALEHHIAHGAGLVYADRLEVMLPLLRVRTPLPPLLLDLNDVEHKLRLGRLAAGPGGLQGAAQRALGLLQIPALVGAEWRAVRRAAVASVCSEVDQAHLRSLGFGRKVTVVPNAVPVPAAAPGLGTQPTVMFLGACDYPPNFDAAERLARRIWPLVRAQVPQARLLLAGKNTDRLPSRAEGIAGVEYRGFVDDLAVFYAQTRVVCCPLMAGSGTRLKLIEAAGYARPMVSTRIGAEGLAFRDGAEILLRETDEAIAGACVELLRDDGACLRLGAQAREAMGRLYDSDAIIGQIEGLVEDVMAARIGPST